MKRGIWTPKQTPSTYATVTEYTAAAYLHCKNCTEIEELHLQDRNVWIHHQKLTSFEAKHQ